MSFFILPHAEPEQPDPVMVHVTDLSTAPFTVAVSTIEPPV